MNRILDCIVNLDPGLVDAGETPQVQEIGLLCVVGRKMRKTVDALEEVLEIVKEIHSPLSQVAHKDLFSIFSPSK